MIKRNKKNNNSLYNVPSNKYKKLNSRTNSFSIN